MRRLILFVLIAVFSAPAFAGVGNRVETAFDEQVINGTGTTMTSRAFNVGNADDVGVWWKQTAGASSGTSHMALYLEAAYAATPDTIFATVSTLTRNVQDARGTINTLTFPNMKYMRLRATGQANQATDSTLTVYLFTQD